MRRILVFLLLGPLVGGWTLAFLYQEPAPAEVLARAYQASVVVIRALPLVYGLGIVYALPTAAVDYGLRNYRWRLAYVTLAGYLFCTLFLFSWRSGMAGLSASVLCSYLANRPKAAPAEQVEQSSRPL